MTDTAAIRQLYKIFKEKGWYLKDSNNSIYDQFCDLLEIMEPQERKLMLELTQRYFWITANEYHNYIQDTLNLIPIEKFDGIKKLYLFPIVKPGDEGKPKSGIALIYDIKSMLPMTKFRNVSPKTLDSFMEYNSAPGTKKDEILCLVDDYIGTGDTLEQCLGEIRRIMPLNYEKIIIISISCQKETYDKLRNQGINIYVKHILPKGITDFNDLQSSKEKKDLMRIIEKNIPGSKSFSLGFQESEAIVTLKRTPDNTFPVFWKKYRKGGKYYNAPFLRID